MTITSLPISPAQLANLRLSDPDMRIIDVRTGGEFETVHIPGSYNIPLDTLNEHVGDLAAVDHPVVLVCQSGGRAAQAHAALETAGKSGLYILDGGMAAWQMTGGETASAGKQRWAMDRQVRLAAGSIALAGVLASVFLPKAKWVAAGVAGGLMFSSITNSCAMAAVLAKLPYNRTDACDIKAVLHQLDQKEAA